MAPGWTMPQQAAKSATEIVALRSGGRAGFYFRLRKTAHEMGAAYVNFYDDAGTYWLLSSYLALEPVADSS